MDSKFKDPCAAKPDSLKDGTNPFDNKGIQPRSGPADTPGKSSASQTESANYKSV